MPLPRIAVVDDDVLSLQLVDMVLTSAGYQTFLWSRGQDAHQKIRDFQPDLVIMDLWLEHRNVGVTLLGLLEQDPATRDIPVIISSADVSHLPDRGHLVLEKPYAPDDLVAKISAVLRHAGVS